jgi:hypothetical protein
VNVTVTRAQIGLKVRFTAADPFDQGIYSAGRSTEYSYGFQRAYLSLDSLLQHYRRFLPAIGCNAGFTQDSDRGPEVVRQPICADGVGLRRKHFDSGIHLPAEVVGHGADQETVALELSLVDLPEVVIGRVDEIVVPIDECDRRHADRSFDEAHMVGGVEIGHKSRIVGLPAATRGEDRPSERAGSPTLAVRGEERVVTEDDIGAN